MGHAGATLGPLICQSDQRDARDAAIADDSASTAVFARAAREEGDAQLEMICTAQNGQINGATGSPRTSIESVLSFGGLPRRTIWVIDAN